MKITVAGVTKEVADGLTVAQLIEQEKVETPQYVTVTINDEEAPECESSDYRCWRTGCTGCNVSGSCWRWYNRHC